MAPSEVTMTCAKYRFGLKKPFCEEVKKSEKVLVAQSCLTLHDLMDCSPPGSSVDGSLQARIPEWVAIPFSRQSSWPKDRTQVSWIVGRLFIIWATREAPDKLQMLWNFNSSSSSEYSELSCCRRLGPIYGYYTYPYNVVPVSWWYIIILDAFTCECRKTEKRLICSWSCYAAVMLFRVCITSMVCVKESVLT